MYSDCTGSYVYQQPLDISRHIANYKMSYVAYIGLVIAKLKNYVNYCEECKVFRGLVSVEFWNINNITIAVQPYMKLHTPTRRHVRARKKRAI